MTDFDDLLSIADAAIDDVAAEPFTLHPRRRSPNGRPATDPERQVATGSGVFSLLVGDAGGVQLGNRSHSRKANNLRTVRDQATPTLSVDVRSPDAPRPRQGDAVEIGDRGRFDVVLVRPDGHRRAVLELAGPA